MSVHRQIHGWILPHLPTSSMIDDLYNYLSVCSAGSENFTQICYPNKSFFFLCINFEAAGREPKICAKHFESDASPQEQTRLWTAWTTSGWTDFQPTHYVQFWLAQWKNCSSLLVGLPLQINEQEGSNNESNSRVGWVGICFETSCACTVTLVEVFQNITMVSFSKFHSQYLAQKLQVFVRSTFQTNTSIAKSMFGIESRAPTTCSIFREPRRCTWR